MNIDLESTIYSLPGIILGLTLHEYCHAFAAYKLGDYTAKEEGRLSFNPIKHIDPIGFIFIIIAGFGWAKPVSFRQSNLKNPRRDKAIIAAAGPFSNLLLGIACLFVVKIFMFAVLHIYYATGIAIPDMIYTIIGNVLLYSGIINLSLFIFNMLPLPPLDGSHIFLSGVRLSATQEEQFMRWGSIILFVIIIAENTMNIDIIPTHLFTQWVASLILG